MFLRLIRLERCEYGVFGQLLDQNNQVICVTAEHAYQNYAGGWTPKIPGGIYTVRRRLSPEFGYEVFELIGVPNHDFIEIHIGNYPQIDSAGCILLGARRSLNMVVDSRETFQHFMETMKGVDEFQLRVDA